MEHNEDLAAALKRALEWSGDLVPLRLQLEEEVLETLSPQTPSATTLLLPRRTRKPAMPPEVILANKVALQYLMYAGFDHTAAVLCAESGLSMKQVSDDVLRLKLSHVRGPSNRPLLYSMVSELLHRKKDKDRKMNN